MDKKLRKTFTDTESGEITGRVSVFVRAIAVKEVGNGRFEIVVPVKPMTEQQARVLGELFPNLADQAYRLLDAEALMASIISEVR